MWQCHSFEIKLFICLTPLPMTTCERTLVAHEITPLQSGQTQVISSFSVILSVTSLEFHNREIMMLLNAHLRSLHLSCFCFFLCWYHKKYHWLYTYLLPHCESLIFLWHNFLLSAQTLPAGIISTGATWSPSTECATTSFTASSAASPVPIQTYNYLRWLSLTKEHGYLD